MINNLVIVFLLANAAFWGFANHETHCKLAPQGRCPPHWVHVYIIGGTAFIGAMLLMKPGIKLGSVALLAFFAMTYAFQDGIVKY
tara:strand:+ start:173 stop:427 length:255 start_codon:yes stop_codon:yes gene_type:complete